MRKLKLLFAVLLPLIMVLFSCPGPMGLTEFVPSGAPHVTAGSVSSSLYQNVSTTTIQVMDSANGSPLNGATIEIYQGVALVHTENLDAASSSFDYSFADGVSYDIVASLADRASCRYQNYVNLSGLDTIVLYLQPLGMTTRPDTAPQITEISFGLSDGTSIDAYDFMPVPRKYLRTVTVTLRGASSIEPTSWSGEGAKLGFNIMPSVFDGLEGFYLYKGIDVGGGEFESKLIFEVPYASLRDGRNDLVFVAYDVANNRVERRLVIDYKDIRTSDEYTTVAAGTVVNPYLELTTYGYSRSYFGVEPDQQLGLVPDAMLDPQTGDPVSYRAKLTFGYQENGQNAAITGYEIWRASASSDFERICRIYYDSEVSGTHTYFDVDPTLEMGVLYMYKIKVYNASAVSTFSDVAQAEFLQSFRTSLSGASDLGWSDWVDATGGLISTRKVNFEFEVSDNGILSTASPKADEFGFLLVIKQKNGEFLAYLDFLYDITNKLGGGYGKYYYRGLNGPTWYPASFVATWSGRFIDIYAGSAGIVHDPGVTYEWNIYGRYLGAGNFSQAPGMSPAYLKKYYSNGVGVSYSDIYQNGNDTSNGWFPYTIADDAE